MANDERFGLTLSLVEALRADPSPDAGELADLLAETDGDEEDVQEENAREVVWRRAPPHPWAALAASMALCIGFAGQGHAAGATLPGANLQGSWRMAAASSVFQEAVTGPAPDTATVTVARDDGDGLAYQLIETRGGVEVARGAYDVSFIGAPSTSSVDGATLRVVAIRDADGGVLIKAPSVDGLQASIHMRRTGVDTALLEHDVVGSRGLMTVERISLVRGAR